MSIHILKNEDKEHWDRYVMGSKASNCYHLSNWKNVIEKSFAHKTYYLFSKNSAGVINGILPLVQMKSMLFGNFMISLPYFNYGGICSDNDEIYSQLLGEAARIAEAEDVSHIEFRHISHNTNDLPVKTTKVSMRLSLPDKSEALWDSFSSKLRSQIRRPVKDGMYLKIGREDELHSFYNIFSVNMRDLGTPVYSREFFRNILLAFPATSWICTVYTKDKKPVASGFLVGFRELLEIPWASSLKTYNRYSPNMFLYWSVLKFACESGYSTFDFGRSTLHESTYKFKEQWGARPVQLFWHYWMKNSGPVPELNPKNPKYQLAIKVWQKLPVALTKIIGPSIVKNLP